MSVPAQILTVLMVGIVAMMIIAAVTRRGLKVTRKEIDFPPPRDLD